MNQTQNEIVAFTFGLFFSFTGIDIFLNNIAPIILNNSTPELNPVLTIMIGLISVLSAYLTFIALKDILNKIEYTYRTHNSIFNWYMTKNVITFVLSFIIFYTIKILIFH
jgi:uncharacterized protein YybS (DUF2232 family)